MEALYKIFRSLAIPACAIVGIAYAVKSLITDNPQTLVFALLFLILSNLYSIQAALDK